MQMDRDKRRQPEPPWAEWSTVQELTDWSFSPGDPAWLRPGEEVDRFVVDARIGQGAHAVVYRVHHHQLGTKHALKVLTNADETVRQRLLQEGRIQAELQHANVVAVTDVLELTGTLGLVMDYVYGPPLADWLRATRPDTEQALEVFRHIVKGVRAAHRLGIVHRDIKPANVLMAWDGERYTPRVTDFGLAKIERKVRAMGSAQALGTPAYMAPEQIRDAARVDPRADIFSLGCVLYELLCGVRPFRTLEIPVLFNEILNGKYPPPEKLNPELPEHLLVTIRRCLEVERWRRPPSCDVLLAMLEGFDDAAAVEPTPAPRLDDDVGALRAGAMLEGRYELAEKLGQGAQGEVWRALDRSKRALDGREPQEVAIKILYRQWLEEPGRAEAFLHSARKVCNLRSRHLVKVLQPYGDHQGRVFFVMELLQGGDLVARLRRGTMPIDEVVKMVDGLSEGLGAAHAVNMVHRNIKPRNVLWSAHGRVVLTDFDLVLPGNDEEERRVDVLDTFLFAAPERASHPHKPLRRADQYSLAMLAVYALNGSALHMGVVYDTRGFLHQLDAPTRVKRVLARALSLDPKLRYDNVLELAEALRGAAASKSTRPGDSGELKDAELQHLEGQPMEITPRSRRLIGAALIGLGVVVGVGASWAWRSAELSASMSEGAQLLPAGLAALGGGAEVPAAASPAPQGGDPPEGASAEGALAEGALAEGALAGGALAEGPRPVSAPPPAVVISPPEAARAALSEPEAPSAPVKFRVTFTMVDAKRRAVLRCKGIKDQTIKGEAVVGFPEPTSCVMESGDAYGSVSISEAASLSCEVLETSISCAPR